MIPRAQVTAWRDRAPWPLDSQVEQDLVLSRALVEIFREPNAADKLAFRGGTALHKLFLLPPSRYSEDLDLVQLEPEPIGDLLDAIRGRLDPWLGEPRRRLGHGRVSLLYRFETSIAPVQSMRLKVEINTREHFSVLGTTHHTFAVDSPWFAESAEIGVFHLDELLATKLRALYQRKKGRDLYDLWRGLEDPRTQPQQIVECFLRYMDHGESTISRAQLEENLDSKLGDPAFLNDIAPLLPVGSSYDHAAAAAAVRAQLVESIPGQPWRRGG